MTDTRRLPARYPVVETAISATSYDEVVGLLADPDPNRATIVAVCNVHSVMQARRQSDLRAALDEADLATPDGMPLVWALRGMFNSNQQRVYGPDIMRQAFGRGVGLKHYLYGSSENTLLLLQERLGRMFPSAEVVGAKSPPFRQLDDAEIGTDAAEILSSGATVVWVGLGMPKQELWMHRVVTKLPGVTVIGVGAAFDFIAGTVPEAPQWMQKSGLEWLYRLAKEPRRLWRRYLWNNPWFLVLVTSQVIRTRWKVGNSARRSRGDL